MKKLSKKGKWAYWIIQLTIDVIIGIVLFGVLDYTFDSEEGRNYLIFGCLASLLVSGLICLAFWKKDNKISEISTEEEVLADK